MCLAKGPSRPLPDRRTLGRRPSTVSSPGSPSPSGPPARSSGRSSGQTQAHPGRRLRPDHRRGGPPRLRSQPGCPVAAGGGCEERRPEIAKKNAETAGKVSRRNERTQRGPAMEKRKPGPMSRIAREKLARVEYGRTMQLAHQEWRDNQCDPGSRFAGRDTGGPQGVEWRYLQHLCHSELLELKGHTAPVTAAAWSHDGSRIATTSADKTARVWDPRTGAEVLTLVGHNSPVFSMSWRPGRLAHRHRQPRRDGAGVGRHHRRRGSRAQGPHRPGGLGGLEPGRPRASPPPVRTRRRGCGMPPSATRVLTLKGHKDCVHSVAWSPDRLAHRHRQAMTGRRGCGTRAQAPRPSPSRAHTNL